MRGSKERRTSRGRPVQQCDGRGARNPPHTATKSIINRTIVDGKTVYVEVGDRVPREHELWAILAVQEDETLTHGELVLQVSILEIKEIRGYLSSSVERISSVDGLLAACVRHIDGVE